MCLLLRKSEKRWGKKLYPGYSQGFEAGAPLRLFGTIRRDPETVLVPPTTTWIPGRILRAGAKAARLFGLLLTRQCTVTTVMLSPVTPHFVISHTWMRPCSPFFQIHIYLESGNTYSSSFELRSACCIAQ